ncbi:MAG: hypothetical protein MUP69_10315 [Candidatus Atribacteria bacterium]|nr:hypothetical protein [Candidatus Atribacteria bacterium]
MLEILKLAANWGFPAFFCILFYWDFRKKIMGLDKTIGNDLTHALEKNTEITKENSTSSDKVEIAIIKMTTSVDGMCNKLSEFINKK